MKKRIYITFVNAAGDEVGIDAGGLFKEMWTTLSEQAFDPNFGLFKTTSDELLYPNHASRAIHSNADELYTFLGRIVAKAVYENIIIGKRFAHFFLTNILGKLCFINDLPSLDMDLYKNLIFLKDYDGDAADLARFSVTNDELGDVTEIELILGVHL